MSSGKQRQAQRTKNNTRPSSSSRSAEKLGTNLPIFVGFSADREGGYVSVLPGFGGNEVVDVNLDPNVQVIFRKMTKKDPTTKLKALNEYNSYIGFSDEAEVCATLSFWPKLYSQLSLDCNHRVREATQSAHAALVTKCGRSIAPYLKLVVPIWIASQFDIYVPARTQAKEAFDKLFPPNKVPEVMGFCRKEIMTFISDNLLLHTPMTLSNPKIFNQEECESIFERTIVMTLRAYELLLINIPDEHIEWLCETQSAILESKKFWDLEKHKSAPIRCSFYAVIGCLCRRVTDWFNPKYGKRSALLLFKKLSEKDAEVIGSVLENSILVMANMKNWWEIVENQNKLLLSIFNTLSEGGYNNALRIAQLLAPLLKQLSSLPDKDSEFYNDFFSAVCRGLEHRNVILYKNGYDGWLLGLIECLKYFAEFNFKSGEAQTLSQPIRMWMNAALSPKIANSTYNYKKIIISRISEILQCWTKDSMSADRGAFYSQVVRLFWKNILSVIHQQIDSVIPDKEEIKKNTDVHIELLKGLKITPEKKKKSVSVKFTTDEIDSNAVTAETPAHIDQTVIENYEHNRNSLIHDTCAKYLSYAKRKNISAPILNPLFTLVYEFNSVRLHEVMLGSIGNNLQIMALYDDCYLKWLQGDSMRSPVVVDLTFSMLAHLQPEQHTYILKTFDQLPLSVLKWCIERCITHTYSSIPAIQSWLHSNTVHDSLIAFSKSIVKEGDKNLLDLVRGCFVQSDSGGILLNKSTCIDIVRIIERSLYDLESDHLNMCALFASYLLSVNNIMTVDNFDTYSKLLISLFTLDCNTHKLEDVLPDDTIFEIKSSWRDALLSLSLENMIYFTKNVSSVLHKQLIEGKKTQKEILNLKDISMNLISSCVEAIDDSENVTEVIRLVLINRTDDVIVNQRRMLTLALLADTLSARFSYILPSDSAMLKQLIEDGDGGNMEFEMHKAVHWMLFAGNMMREMIEQLDVHTDSIDSLYEEILVDIMYNYSVLHMVHSEYKMCKWYGEINELYDPIESSVLSLFNELPNPLFKSVYDRLKAKADAEGLYWSKCVYVCDFKLNRADRTNEGQVELENLIVSTIQKLIMFKDLDELFGSKFCHIIQLLIYDNDSRNDDGLKMKIVGIIAMRHLYSKYSICGEQSKLKLNLDDLLAMLKTPRDYLTVITDVHFLHKDLMLFDTDITKTDWSLIQCNAAILKFLTICVDQLGWEMKIDEWDFIMISLSSLLQSINISKDSWKSFKVSTLSCAVFELFATVTKFASSILTESVRKEPTEAIVHLLDEWRELFSPEMHKHVYEIFIYVCKDCISTPLNLTSSTIYFIRSLSTAMDNFDYKYLNREKIKNHTSSYILKKCLAIMASPNHQILKFMANSVLKALTASLVEGDKAEGSRTNPDEDVPANLSVYSIESTLKQLQGCMDAVLAPYKVGADTCVLVPYTDGHSIALGYLLVWEVLLDIAQESTAYLQHGYSEFFRQGEYVDRLLNVLFRLLPLELAETTSAGADYFKNTTKLSYNEPITMKTISQLACDRLLRCLQGGWLGALVRNWWGALPTKTSQFVELIVRTHVSPILISNQLAGVSKNQNKIPNIEISIHNSVNEVVCIYVIEDLKMGLTIQMCSNHPLNKPNVVSSGTPLNNMAWLSMYLSHQNGSIYQAIKMWANAVQKKVESTPVCYVCYSRLHPSTGQLPKMLCQTCKNKFHNACLNRWFATSGKTTCPMCRNNFLPN